MVNLVIRLIELIEFQRLDYCRLIAVVNGERRATVHETPSGEEKWPQKGTRPQKFL